ncbi:TPA: hypothetical protein DEP94_01755 [Candidatus Nomurabacteria bacterium]|nr:hypothetical protein [Candidatus Nomurabacteria bacterium]
MSCMEKEKKQFDVVGIGSPLLDFIVEVDDSLLTDIHLNKGEMHLVDKETSEKIFEKISGRHITIAPGGSSANTLSGVSALGGQTVFMGKIGGDAHGATYEEMTRDDGVIPRLIRETDITTGHAITFITPDGERTFATHLGASLYFKKEDVNDIDIVASKILHCEGYQLEDLELRASVIHAMRVAQEHGTKISIDLSDAALIGRNLDVVRKLITDYVDIVFVNDDEAEALTGKSGEEALRSIAGSCEIVIVKQGEKGSLIYMNGEVHVISPHEVIVANTNGAGDMYAAGILYSLVNNIPLHRGGALASFAAAQVVSSVGARLDETLKKKIKDYTMTTIIT